MKVELELTDMFGHVLLRLESAYGMTAMPNIGDLVSIESKQWEVARRHFHYQANGNLHKVAVQCKENDL